MATISVPGVRYKGQKKKSDEDKKREAARRMHERSLRQRSESQVSSQKHQSSEASKARKAAQADREAERRLKVLELLKDRKDTDPRALMRMVAAGSGSSGGGPRVGGGSLPGGGAPGAFELNEAIRQRRNAQFAQGRRANVIQGALDRKRIQGNIKAGVNVPYIGYQATPGGEYHTYNPKIASPTSVLGDDGRPVRVPGVATSDQERQDYMQDRQDTRLRGLQAERGVAESNVRGLDRYMDNLRGAREKLAGTTQRALSQVPGGQAVAGTMQAGGAAGVVGQQLGPTVMNAASGMAGYDLAGTGRALDRAMERVMPEYEAAQARLAALYSPERLQQVEQGAMQGGPMVLRTPEQAAQVQQQLQASISPAESALGQRAMAFGQAGMPISGLTTAATMAGTQAPLNQYAQALERQQATAPIGTRGPYDQMTRDFAQAEEQARALYGFQGLPGQTPVAPAQPAAPTGPGAPNAQPQSAPAAPPPTVPFPITGGAGAGGEGGDLFGTPRETPAERAARLLAEARAREADARAGATETATGRMKSGAGGESKLSLEDQNYITAQANSLMDIGSYAPPNAVEMVTGGGVGGWANRNIPFWDYGNAAMEGRPLLTERIALLPQTIEAYKGAIRQRLDGARASRTPGAVRAMVSAIKGSKSYLGLPPSVRVKIESVFYEYQ